MRTSESCREFQGVSPTTLRSKKKYFAYFRKIYKERFSATATLLCLVESTGSDQTSCVPAHLVENFKEYLLQPLDRKNNISPILEKFTNKIGCYSNATLFSGVDRK